MYAPPGTQLSGVGKTTIQTIGGGITNLAAMQHQKITQQSIALQGYSQIQYIPYESYYIDY